MGSIIGAFKANSSYKKCKQLTNFANLKVALDECQLIFENCSKLLRLCGGDISKYGRGVNIKNEVVSPFFNTKKEAINYLDNGGKIDDTWMFSLEYVRVWSE